jgi:hypothetical protein
MANDIKLNKAAPVALRPRCPQCRRPLAPLFETVRYERVDSTGKVIDENARTLGYSTRAVTEWRGSYHGYGHFDKLRCAADFANKVVDERLKKAGLK